MKRESVELKEIDASANGDNDSYTCLPKNLSDNELSCLDAQNSRLVETYRANLLEKDCKRHWDLFYKRNEARFFKDRHWTTREFEELLDQGATSLRTLLEIGCGVGNFIFPLIKEKLNLKVLACDLSPRAIELLRSNPSFDPDVIKAFQCDVTTDQIFNEIGYETVDIITLIFVLSAIHPNKFISTLKSAYKLLKPGGTVLFRDYGLYDMAQLRFKPGHKIDENFYMRQDGTRTYYFSTDFVENIFLSSGFKVISNTYIHKRTINKKENIDVPRVFVQVKACRSTCSE